MRLTIDLDAAAAAFYTRVAESARLPLETVVADALFKRASFPSKRSASPDRRPVPGYHDSGTGHFFHLLRRFFAVFVPLPDMAGIVFSMAECYNIRDHRNMEGSRMKSIRDVYKIGKGPSSSHTMGPERAARLFLSKYPDAETYRVVLYGSLSKTGRGHGTDRVLYEVLGRERTEVVFSEETPHSLPHPNTLDFFACREGKPYATMRVASIGGGDIRIEGQDAPEEQDEVYPENSFAEIAQFCRWRYISLSEYVELNEGPGIWDFLAEVWQTMKQAIADGLAAEGTLPGGLNVERKAKRLYAQSKENERPQVRELRIVCAYAFAVSEQNADNGTIVTAPTCGSAGVLPAVLLYMQRTHNIPDAQVLRALAVAGLFGALVKRNGSISGAECGCQAEIGTACSMAAAALCALMGLSIEETEYAAEIAMEHHLGLTCDPICGLVQIPCIERNAVAAKRAMDAFNLSGLLCGSRNISFDMVVRTMKETGLHISAKYRETSEGGLAKLYDRRAAN